MLKSLFATLSCILALHFSMNAQQQLVWKAQNVEITLPDDFKITKNTDTEFEAKGNTPERWVQMFQVSYPLKMEEGTEDESPEGLSYASDKYGIMAVKRYELFETDALKAFCLDGYDKDAKKVFFTGYKNQKTNKEFIIVLPYNSKENRSTFLEYIKSVKN